MPGPDDLIPSIGQPPPPPFSTNPTPPTGPLGVIFFVFSAVYAVDCLIRRQVPWFKKTGMDNPNTLPFWLNEKWFFVIITILFFTFVSFLLFWIAYKLIFYWFKKQNKTDSCKYENLWLKKFFFLPAFKLKFFSILFLVLFIISFIISFIILYFSVSFF